MMLQESTFLVLQQQVFWALAFEQSLVADASWDKKGLRG